MKTVRTTFTCDRCDGNADYKACNGDPPHAEAYFSSGLFGGGDPSKAPRKDLCRDCYDSLDAWLKGGRASVCRLKSA